jgi:1-acyl-sn-glycerol-3-phosphate acyltransferase
MSPALVDLSGNVPGMPRPRAGRTIQLRRTLGLGLSIGTQWLASATFLPRLEGATWESAIRHLCGGAVRALGVKVAVAGDTTLAQRPTLVVANHISWLDSYVIHSLIGCRFVAKDDSSTWPIFRTLLKGGKSITISRGSARGAMKAKEAVEAALRNGDRVGLFAEGTTTDGTSLGDFHPALFQAAIETAAPIQPIALSYRTPDGVVVTSPAYWGDITFAQSAAAVIREPAIVARVEFCAPITPVNMTRRQLADEARSRIAQKLELRMIESTAGIEVPGCAEGICPWLESRTQ